MGWTNFPSWSVNQILTAANLNTYIRDNGNWDHNLGTLAYAEITSNQTGITSPTTITGLTVAPTIVAGRRIKITVFAPAMGALATADAYTASLYEGTTLLQQVTPVSTAPMIGDVNFIWVGTPSGGVHTYHVEGNHTVGATAGTWYASSTARSFVLVEDIGV